MEIIYLLFAACVTLTLGLYAFKERENQDSLPFAALMFAASIHTFGYAFELLVTGPYAIMWLNIEYAGIAFLPVLILWFTYTNANEVDKGQKLILLFSFALSLTTFFMVQTNEFHHFYYRQIIIHTNNRLELIKGPWFYVQAVSLGFSMLIFLRSAIKMYRTSVANYKKRAKSMLVSLLISGVACLFFVFGYLPGDIDVFPFLYGLMGVVWFMDFLRDGVFDIMPISYKSVFENISEGVIVIDKNNTIVNFNLAAYDVFKSEKKLKSGMFISDILEVIVPVHHTGYSGQVFEIRSRNKKKIYQMKSTALYDASQDHKGKILVFGEITKEVEASRILTSLATQDSLTGLSNRRHFFDRCKDKIEEAKVSGIRISFVMMDIDFFKQINDKYGHVVGDAILKEVSDISKDLLRPSDIMGRYGGEEFAILIYDISLAETHMIIERMRNMIENHNFIGEDHEIKLTVSFGVHRPNLLEEDDMNVILKKADKSLYQAKDQGRNRMVLYNEIK